MLLNLAASVASSRANGPGLRAVVWVQGCTLGCRGCHNAHLWANTANKIVTVESVVEWFKSKPGQRGLTISGGEPFEQALALAELARQVRGVGADVIVFSGFTLDELQSGVRPHSWTLLNQTDLLVDGRFERDQPTQQPLIGSANQRLHFLSGRIQEGEVAGLPRGEWIGDGEHGRVTGFALAKTLRVMGLQRSKA